MKVIAKYKTVEVTFEDKCISLKFNSIRDALTYTDWYKKAVAIRDRAKLDASYPEALRTYLENKGIIRADLFLSRQRLQRKVALLASLAPRWL